MSHQPAEHDGSTRLEPYRMTFGKFRGLNIQQLPHDYRESLIDAYIYEHHPDFKSALVAGGYLQPIKETDGHAVSPARKRKASDSPVPSSSRPPKRAASSAKQSDNSTPKRADNQQAADLYYFDFGMHAGKELREVPPNYVDWLIKKEIHTSRPTLAAALRVLGRLDSPRPAPRVSSWRAPPISEARGNCFHEPPFGSPRWISDKDTATYFNLRVSMLAGAGVRILSDWDLDMNTEYGSMLCSNRAPKRWLYQVFTCAQHFNTASHGTAQQALQRFLSKNKQREGETMTGLVLN